MAQETLISPGVLTRENDYSQITQGTIRDEDSKKK